MPIALSYRGNETSNATLWLYYVLDGSISNSDRSKISALLQSAQAGSGAQPASYSVSTGVISWGVKRPGREVKHSPPSNSEARNGES